ncbi:hypothetical protein E4U42_003495 [Claviceps africana]|uniref:5-hydroxyisourate hydrolase n=1 Tax=Claviceps africana TaxID=83212 RepID=A0A8K0JCR3_9HYPO|nr:hypothetical protein E4U42_003495 [Claviceps africana]
MTTRDPITCHVLDTTTGLPARSLRVRLEGGTPPLKTFESSTDDDGRIRTWLPYSSDTSAGEVPVYTLHDVLGQLDDGAPSSWTLRFDTAGYFGERQETFFPEVVVAFRVHAGQQYHVPLLLGPFSYTTYRGS